MNEMRSIVAASLRFRHLVVFAAAILVLFGIDRIRNLPVDVFPEFAPPRVEIQTPSLGLSSVEVEALVTIPLEEALAGVPGLDVMRSKSVEQLSSILLIFKPGTDLMEARQLVQERLAIATPSLPTWASPPMMLPPLSSTARTMKIGISSDKHSLMDLSMIAYWKIRQRLLQVPGVANVAIWGERIKMLQVQVEPKLLSANRVSVNEVIQVTSDTLDVGLLQYSDGSTVGTGGFIETPNQRLAIQHVQPVVTPEDLSQVPINDRKAQDGTPLRLRDIGRLVEDTWPMIGDAVINDGPGLLLVVEKFPWANTVEVTRGVEAAMEAMRPGLPDIEIDTTIFRPATFVETALDNLTESLLLGALLVVVVLLLFLWDWRIATISATIIPVTAVITLLLLSLLGTTLNVMVLAGLVIAIGAVVDDAIVDVENIVRRLRQERQQGSRKPTADIVLDASLEVRSAIVNASLIEMGALLPVFFMQGLSGAFFRPLALAYVVATLVSPLVALTVTPALILILLDRAPIRERLSPIIPWLHRRYEAAIGQTIRKPRLAYVTLVVLFVAMIIVWPLLGRELLPSFKERDFLMHWLTKPGTSHPEMVRISTRACQELRTIPGVRNCGSHIGQALLMDEVYGIYFGENWVSVDPAVDYDATLARIQELVDGYPGLHRDVQTYLKERVREVLTGSSYPIIVRIYGEDLGILRAKAEEVRAKLASIAGLKDLHVEFLVDIPQVEVEVDLDAARRYGLKPGDVRRAAAFLVAGEEAGDIHVAHRTYDVQVWSTPETRSSLTDIQNLLIDTPNTGKVRLSEVADVRLVPTPNAINREGLARRINVEANLAGRDLGSVVTDVERALDEIEFPHGYHPELIGEYAERQQASQRILVAGLVATVFIFFLLRVSLGSWRLATMSFISLPMALVGGVLAAYFAGGGVLTLGSLVGFLTILGVAARNGIMLISHYQHLEEYESEPFGLPLVIRGGRERVAPIMMTALTAGLALVPLAVAGNIPGHEIEHPMAIVILGGLVTSTLVNLFIVPILYLRFATRTVATKTEDLQPLGRINYNSEILQTLKIRKRWFVVLGLLLASAAGLWILRTGNAPTPGADYEEFDPAWFDERSTTIDNPWFPLKPGTQLVYEGETVEEGQRVPHRVVLTVTDLVKVIDGVANLVVWDIDESDGELIETELAFFAQDESGNVWHFGQYPEEYESGEFLAAPTWIHGLEEARAGIAMKASPTLGMPSYSQGWGPAVNWTDRAQVSAVGERTCVPAGCYEDVLVMEETSREEPNAFQLKYYARGVGNVRVGWKGEDATQETLELIDFKQLSPEELEEVRLEALELEKRAYETSKVYAQTQPAQQTLHIDNQ